MTIPPDQIRAATELAVAASKVFDGKDAGVVMLAIESIITSLMSSFVAAHPEHSLDDVLELHIDALKSWRSKHGI